MSEGSSSWWPFRRRRRRDPHAHKYGADLTPRQYSVLVAALCMGTFLEWLEFTVYSSLNTVLTHVFFPDSSSAAVKQVCYFGIFALGLAARPIGSLLFGHLGDAHGRRVAMVASIATITIPTVLIGALPTYDQAGLAAPVLLAVLRFVQGLAVGGEFGSAIVFLWELAPPHRKGFISCLGVAAVSPGIITGMLLVLAVVTACSPNQLLVWGWRLPFLAVLLTAPISVVTRLHLPEPKEWLQARDHAARRRGALSRAHSTAAATRGSSSVISISGGARMMSRRLSGAGSIARLASVREAAAAAATCDMELRQHLSLTAALPRMRSSKGSAALPTPQQLEAALAAVAAEEGFEAAAAAAVAGGKAAVVGAGGALPPACHLPLVVLARDHWLTVVLQVLLEAGFGAAFYLMFSYVPPQLQLLRGVSLAKSTWMGMLQMLAFYVSVLVLGWANDKGARALTVYACLMAVVASLAVPLFGWLRYGPQAIMWALQPLAFMVIGCFGGLLTDIIPHFYPAGCRSSGYNLGHAAAMAFGGLSPLIVSSIARYGVAPFTAAGVVTAVSCGISLLAALLLMRLFPAANARWPHCAPPAKLPASRQPSVAVATVVEVAASLGLNSAAAGSLSIIGGSGMVAAGSAAA